MLFNRKELERLGCTELETEMTLKYQEKFPIILDNEDNLEKFCIDARTLWEQLDRPQGRFNMWVDRKFNDYLFTKGEDYIDKPMPTTLDSKPAQICAPLKSGVSEVIPTPQKEKFAGADKAKDYLLSLDMAKGLAMVDKKESGAIARRYFMTMEKIVRENKDWLLVREPEKKEYKEMCSALNDYTMKIYSREADKYDYAREANMLNVIATGCQAQEIRSFFKIYNSSDLTRDSLEKDYNEKISFLQAQDTLYIIGGMSYQQRVQMMIMTMDAKYPNAKPLLPNKDRNYLIERRKTLLS